jgi:hypothetical protein
MLQESDRRVVEKRQASYQSPRGRKHDWSWLSRSEPATPPLSPLGIQFTPQTVLSDTASLQGLAVHCGDSRANTSSGLSSSVFAVFRNFLEKASCGRGSERKQSHPCLSAELRRTTLLLGKRSSWEKEFIGPNARTDLFDGGIDKLPKMVNAKRSATIGGTATDPFREAAEVKSAARMPAPEGITAAPRKLFSVSESQRVAPGLRANASRASAANPNSKLASDESHEKADLAALLDYFAQPMDPNVANLESCDDYKARIATASSEMKDRREHIMQRQNDLPSNVTLRTSRIQSSKSEQIKYHSCGDSGLDSRVRSELKRKVDRFESPSIIQDPQAKRFQSASAQGQSISPALSTISDNLDKKHCNADHLGAGISVRVANRFENVPSPLRTGRSIESMQRFRLH